MAQQTINLGAGPNDNTGDDLRTGGGKINANFSELYASIDALPESVRDTIGAALTAGSGISVTVNDAGDTITISSSVTQYTDEMARDALGAALVEGAGIDITVNDGGDTITIAATGGGGGGGLLDTNWFNVVDYGATGDGSTDDTSAIQSAINACAAAGGGTVFFPVPTSYYKVAGALQDTSGANAQITMPQIKYATDGTTGNQVTIELRGEKVPPSVVSVIGAWPAPANVSVIRSTLASGTGACIGGYGPSGSAANFTNMRLVMRNLVVQMPANPTNSAVNASRIAQFESENLLIHCGEFYAASVAAQTTSTSYGLKLPERYNGAFTRVRSTNVIGFYNAFSLGEHANLDDAFAWACTNAFTVAVQDHAIIGGRLCIHHCKNGLVATGAAYVDIQQFNIEHAASGTWTPTYDVSDASNNLRGGLKWHVILAGTGADSGFLSTGANRFKRERLQRIADPMTLTDGATVTIDCNQGDTFFWTIGGNRTLANPVNPWSGQVINIHIAQDATGGRAWTLGSQFKFPGNVHVLSTLANAVDLVSCQYRADTGNWLCSLIKDLS